MKQLPQLLPYCVFHLLPCLMLFQFYVSHPLSVELDLRSQRAELIIIPHIATRDIHVPVRTTLITIDQHIPFPTDFDAQPRRVEVGLAQEAFNV